MLTFQMYVTRNVYVLEGVFQQPFSLKSDKSLVNFVKFIHRNKTEQLNFMFTLVSVLRFIVSEM